MQKELTVKDFVELINKDEKLRKEFERAAKEHNVDLSQIAGGPLKAF